MLARLIIIELMHHKPEEIDVSFSITAAQKGIIEILVPAESMISEDARLLLKGMSRKEIQETIGPHYVNLIADHLASHHIGKLIKATASLSSFARGVLSDDRSAHRDFAIAIGRDYVLLRAPLSRMNDLIKDFFRTRPVCVRN